MVVNIGLLTSQKYDDAVPTTSAGHSANLDTARAHSMAARIVSDGDESESDRSEYSRRQRRMEKIIRQFESSDSGDDYEPPEASPDESEDEPVNGKQLARKSQTANIRTVRQVL